LVLLAHKNGSIMVRRRVAEVKQVKADFFRDGTFFIPHRLSIHHMLAHRFFSDLGLRPGVPGGEDDINLTFEVVPPIKMPEFLSKSPEARGFMVAEPIGTRAIAAGVADLQFLSGQAWPDHPCCVVVFRAEVLVERPVAVQEFVSLLVESGRFISGQPDKAAEIALDFLDPKRTIGLTKSVLKNVLTEPQGITTDDLYPVIEDLDKIQRYMSQQMGIGQIIDLESFVDLRFADQACPTGPKAARPERTITADLALADSSRATKSMLDKEGKYLTFHLAGQEYGIDVLKVKEIIGLAPITPVPRTPAYVKGVFNLRGKVIPVVDLRLKFDLEAVDYTDRTCIVVLETAGHAGAIQVGAVVDSVAEVSHIPATEIEEAPTFGVAVDTRYIMAMAKISQGVKILLDIDRVVGQEGGLALEA
jgi:chemotaxis signal transduction protein